MRVLCSIVLVSVVCAWSGLGAAGEKIKTTARPVSLFWDQERRAFCCEVLTVPNDRGFLVCDDSTDKPVMEELFRLGKQDAACTLTGEVTGREGDFERLVVDRVDPVQDQAR